MNWNSIAAIAIAIFVLWRVYALHKSGGLAALMEKSRNSPQHWGTFIALMLAVFLFVYLLIKLYRRLICLFLPNLHAGSPAATNSGKLAGIDTVLFAPVAIFSLRAFFIGQAAYVGADEHGSSFRCRRQYRARFCPGARVKRAGAHLRGWK